MPKGPKGEKRPADVIGAAVMVAKIATAKSLRTTVPSRRRTKTLPSLPARADGAGSRIERKTANRNREKSCTKKVAKGLIELRLPVENVLCLGTAGERCTRQKGGDRGSLPDMGCKSGF
jgi:hypothetical protein